MTEHAWFPKPAPWRDAHYLAFVRDHDCIGCNHPRPNEAHHYMQGDGGMGRKPDDYYTAPLCRKCHHHWHQQSFLPCFDWRAPGEPSMQGGEGKDFRIAHEQSRAIMYQAQAKLLAEWLRIGDAETVRPPAPDSKGLF